MSTALARTEIELQMLETLVDGAFQHARRFHSLALAETDTARMLPLFDAYRRASQAVRLGVRLCMALRAPMRPMAATAAVAQADPDAPRPEPAETSDSATGAVEAERDRESEPTSLPAFLAAVGHVADDVDRLSPQTGASLRDLLARAKALAAQPPTPAPPDVLTHRPTPQFATSAAAVVLARPRPDSS